MLEISEIPCPLSNGADERSCLAICIREATRLLGCSRDEIGYIELRRKSIDARKKSDIHFMLSARLELSGDIDELEALGRVPTRARRRVRAVDPSEPLHCGRPPLGERVPPRTRRRPFSRSYGAILPSSLTMVDPIASVCSTHPPVSVCGTGGDAPA